MRDGGDSDKSMGVLSGTPGANNIGELGRRVYDIGKVSNSSINIHQTSSGGPLNVKVELLIFNY